jgi:3-methylfumaryl-CoA hydratase
MSVTADESDHGDLGPPVSRVEVCSVAAARRVAAMLDLDPASVVEGDALPRGWHFILMGADTPRSVLRPDGYPGLGVPMPDVGLPRLLLMGRTVAFAHDIPIGANLRRISSVQSLTRKETPSGPTVKVTIRHELSTESDATPAIAETQTFLLLAPRIGPATQNNDASVTRISADRTKTVVPDQTLLFQYSALGFNSHKIHLDRSYARDVEGFPDLVVNGGLSTLLLSEFLRRELSLKPTALRVRHVAPLFCDRPMTLAAHRAEEYWRLSAFDHEGRLAVEMQADVQ